MRAAIPVALALAAACAEPGAAAERSVDIPGRSFAPGSVDVLPGDRVTWTNHDFFRHDLAGVDGSFTSGPLDGGATFSHVFGTPGTYPYRCILHPFMTGQVDVFAFGLNGPATSTPVGGHARLHGIAPPGTARVAIEQRSAGGGFEHVGDVAPDADGHFSHTVVPSAPTTYRAIAGDQASLPLDLPVSARLELTARRLPGGRLALRASASPAQAGAPAALQVYSRERFAWRSVDRGRLGGDSTVTFTVHPARRLRARVALLRGVAGYAPATSAPRGIRPPGR